MKNPDIFSFISSNFPQNKTAIIYKDFSLTYGQLNNIVAFNSVKLCGSAKFKTAVIDCNNKLKELIATLCCFLARVTAVPISNLYDKKHIIKEITPDIIINDTTIELAADINMKTINKTSRSIALIVYTSGTSGNPKGAMLTYKNIIFNIKNIAGYMNYSYTDKILVSRPLSHISVLVGDCLVALFSGLEIYLYDEEFNPKLLLTFLKEKNITVFNATPTIFGILSKLKKEALQLKKSIISGEVLVKETALMIAEKFKETEIFTAYGLTETAPRISMGKLNFTDSINIGQGKALAGIKVKINNGELFVKSPGTMKSYYNNKKLTCKKKRFGWLKTGDRAYIEKNKDIVILGRVDEMVIRAGVNIYPQEIENILLKNDFIKECRIYGKTNVFLEVISELEITELYKLCRAVLPLHQIPNKIFKVDTIKKTPSGKIKRN